VWDRSKRQSFVHHTQAVRLLAAERLASGGNSANREEEPVPVWSTATNFVHHHPSREARARRAARFRSKNPAYQEEKTVAVWSEAKLRDKNK